MKRSNWILYLYECDEKKQLFKIMEFKTIRELSDVLNIEAQVISNAADEALTALENRKKKFDAT